jgi:hypothetical protein
VSRPGTCYNPNVKRPHQGWHWPSAPRTHPKPSPSLALPCALRATILPLDAPRALQGGGPQRNRQRATHPRLGSVGCSPTVKPALVIDCPTLQQPCCNAPSSLLRLCQTWSDTMRSPCVSVPRTETPASSWLLAPPQTRPSAVVSGRALSPLPPGACHPPLRFYIPSHAVHWYFPLVRYPQDNLMFFQWGALPVWGVRCDHSPQADRQVFTRLQGCRLDAPGRDYLPGGA